MELGAEVSDEHLLFSFPICKSEFLFIIYVTFPFFLNAETLSFGHRSVQRCTPKERCGENSAYPPFLGLIIINSWLLNFVPVLLIFSGYEGENEQPCPEFRNASRPR